MSNEPGETLARMPNENRQTETKPTVMEGLVGDAARNLDGMNQAFKRITGRNVSINAEAANVSCEQGDKIGERSRELLERSKKTTSRYMEALSMYTKIIILGSIGAALPVQEPVYHEATLQEQVVRAKNEMETKGITTEQKGTYIQVVNDFIYKGIEPVNYELNDERHLMGLGSVVPIEKIKKILPNIIFGREFDDIDFKQEGEDAWRLYLGIPQQNKTFGVSDYMPSKSMEQKYYFKLNGFWDKMIEERFGGDERTMVQGLLDDVNDAHFSYNWVMGDYTLQKGEDEKGSYISYYDKWDLDKIPIERDGIFGKPYEIYDRFYYDPQTLEPVRPIAKK